MSAITEQSYPKLCTNCTRKDKRSDLENTRELILYSKDKKSAISKQDVEKYRMAFDQTHKMYICQKCGGMSAPAHLKLFWNKCSECGQKGLNFENQEKNIRKIKKLILVKEDGKLREITQEEFEKMPKEKHTELRRNNDIKIVKKEYLVDNPDQQIIKCISCGHEGKDSNGRLY